MVDIFDDSYGKPVDIKVSDNKIVKGSDINISAKDPTMTNVVVGVGWQLNAFDTDTLDLDVSCFLLNKDGLTREDPDFVFYNNLEGCNGAVVHNGDSLTGAGDGDDETISIALNNIPYDVIKLVFVLSIYRGEEKEQSVSNIRNGYIRLLNASNSQELLRYEITPDIVDQTETAMIVASINREGPKWHFEAVGECIEGGLPKIATDYGMIIHTG